MSALRSASKRHDSTSRDRIIFNNSPDKKSIASVYSVADSPMRQKTPMKSQFAPQNTSPMKEDSIDVSSQLDSIVRAQSLLIDTDIVNQTVLADGRRTTIGNFSKRYDIGHKRMSIDVTKCTPRRKISITSRQ